MSTLTTPPASTGEEQSPRSPREGDGTLGPIQDVAFGRLFRVELRKQYDTVASRWLLGGIAAVTVVVFVIMLFTNGGDFSWMNYLTASITPLSILLPIVGIMAATSEWSQHTAMTTFALEPRRGRIIWAKVLSSLLLGAVLFVVAVVVSAVVHQVAISARGIDGDWSVAWWTIAGGAGLLALNMLMGTAFGFALLNTPGSIVAFFAVPLGVSGASALIPSWSTFFAWVDVNQTSAPLLTGQSLTGEQWAQLAVTVAIWVALPMLVGVCRVLRREVK
ncbi:MAG: ABC transporter permease [Ornithinimicrobium sp.]